MSIKPGFRWVSRDTQSATRACLKSGSANPELLRVSAINATISYLLQGDNPVKFSPSLLIFGVFSFSLSASTLKGLFVLVAIFRWDTGPIPITAASVLSVGTERIAPTIEQAFDLGFPVVEIPPGAVRGEPGYYSVSPGNWCQSDPSAVGGRHVKGRGTVKYECFLRHDVGPAVTHRYYGTNRPKGQILYDISAVDFEVNDVESGHIWRAGRISSKHWFVTIDILQAIFSCSNLFCLHGDFSVASPTFRASRPY